MLTLPTEIMLVLTPFMQVFSRRIWDWAQVLVVGAVLAPGKRTVTAILQVMGLKDERQYQNYHRVLNRASWSALAVSQVLLGLLVGAFLTEAEPLILGADDTLERRWGGAHQSAQHLSRQPALQSPLSPLRAGLALVECDGPGATALVSATVGLALSDAVGPQSANECRSWLPAQDAGGLVDWQCSCGAALAAEAPHHHRQRWQLEWSEVGMGLSAIPRHPGESFELASRLA